jgi:hypothetical protein
VGRKEVNCGIGVGPGYLQAGLNYGEKVGTAGR